MNQNVTRRGFLKRTAAAGAALAVPTIVPASVFGKSAPSNQTTVGSIGVGGRGSGLLFEAAGHPNVKVLGVCAMRFKIAASSGRQS